MNEISQLKMTPLDLAVTDDTLLTLKLLLPYVPSEFQSLLGVYTKFAEFQNTLSYFSHFRKTKSVIKAQQTLNLEQLIQDFKSYYPKKNFEMFESLLQVMHMMELMQDFPMEDMMGNLNLNDMFQMFTQERKEHNGNMDESSCNEKSRSH